MITSPGLPHKSARSEIYITFNPDIFFASHGILLIHQALRSCFSKPDLFSTPFYPPIHFRAGFSAFFMRLHILCACLPYSLNFVYNGVS